jgi:hypothetical protein
MKAIHFIAVGSAALVGGCTFVETPGRPTGGYHQPMARYVEICHPRGETLSVPESALDSYLRQGAYQGPCQMRQPPRQAEPRRDHRPYPEPVQARPEPEHRPPRRQPRPDHEVRPVAPPSVTICHNGVTLQVAEPQAQEYLRQGARHGTCPITPARPTPPPMQKPAPVYSPPPAQSVTICYNGATLNVSDAEAKNYLRQGARYGTCPVTPPSTPARPTPPPAQSVTICYNGATLNVSDAEAKNYLRQGARYGTCPITPPSTPIQKPAPVQNPPTAQNVTICYNGMTLNVSAAEAKNYLNQGARYGTCPITPPSTPAKQPTPVQSPPPVRTPKPSGQAPAERMITICHNGKNTLTLPESAIPAHLQHGDQYGPCP